MYQIVIDSCGELTEELKKDGHFQTVSLELEIDGYRIRDDETFDQKDFLRRVRESADCPKSSCPSPEQYMEACSKEAERVYVVTLSEKLSGSYNSAQLGKQLYEEEYRDSKKQIHVFNSRSASVGETLIAMKIQELEEQGLSVTTRRLTRRIFCAECGRARIVQSRPVRLPSSIWRHAAKRRSACMS